MPWGGIAAVGAGAAVGAWMRWWLSVVLNPLFPTVPMGTLVSNLVGGLLMGFAMEIINRHSNLSLEMQLLATTGFLGGLTTFSTFSAEVVMLLQQGRTTWALGAVAAHLLGSLLMTFAGIATVVWLKA